MNEINQSIKRFSVGLDVGSSKICGIVMSEGVTSGTYSVLALSSRPNFGSRRGVISNIDDVASAIGAVINDLEENLGDLREKFGDLAETLGDKIINEVVLGISGGNIESFSESFNVIISGSDQIVTPEDVNRLNAQIKRSKTSPDKSIIQIIPYQYFKNNDAKDVIFNPIGHYANKLQANVHILMALNDNIKGINICLERNSLQLSDLLYQPLASSSALLSGEEVVVGVCVIDIGAETTGISIFGNKVLLFSKIIPFGSKVITDEIQKVLKTTPSEADRIKIEHGFAVEGEILRNEIVQIKGVGVAPHTKIDKIGLCKIINPVITELLEACKEVIGKSGFKDSIGAGYLLTGGGANLKGICNLASEIFSSPVGIGYPSSELFIGVSNEIEYPGYSAAVGLALHSLCKKSFVGETIKTLNNLDSVKRSEKLRHKKVDEELLSDNPPLVTAKKGFFDRLKERMLNFIG